MWRPDLKPLPCPHRVAATRAGGRHFFAVREAVPSGTVLAISLCVEVSVAVVDQFPVLWDIVMMGAVSQKVRARYDAAVCWKPIHAHNCLRVKFCRH